MLDKKGKSNTRERCELWHRFLEIFGDCKIEFLTADREFVGKEWFDYLLCEPYNRFRIRFRKNTLLTMVRKNYGLTFVSKTSKLVNRRVR